MRSDLYLRILIVSVSIILAIGSIEIIKYIEKTQLIRIPIFEGQLTVFPEIKEFTVNVDINPGYFTSIGRVYVYYYSPYAEYFETFEVEMSLDKIHWVKVPFYSSLRNIEDYGNFADLGYKELDKPIIEIYGKSFIPPQNLTIPIPNVTDEEVKNSIQGHGIIKRETTPRDEAIRFLAEVSLFGAIFGVLNSFIPVRFKSIHKRKEEKFRN